MFFAVLAHDLVPYSFEHNDALELHAVLYQLLDCTADKVRRV